MSFQFMALYTGDYRRDTQHLSMMEHGCYLLMLMHCWDQRGPLPLDERRVFAICNARSNEEMGAARNVLGEFFTRMDDGHYNHRMQREIERANAISGVRSDAGKRGYEAKAKHLLSKSQAIAKQVPLPPPPPPPLQPQVPQENIEPAALVALPDGKSAPKGYRCPPCNAEMLVSMYAEALPMLPQVAVLNESRKRALSVRWREVCAAEKYTQEQALEWFKWLFDHVAKSQFLTGHGRPREGRIWRADLDWLLVPANFARVIEGRYHTENS